MRIENRFVGLLLFFTLTLLGTGRVLQGGPGDTEFEKILDHYLIIQDALASDSLAGVEQAGERISRITAEARVTDGKAEKLFREMGGAAGDMAGKSLAEARQSFGTLSAAALVYLNQHYSGSRTFYRYFCGMAKKGWIQAREGVRNPYYGSEMLQCGELVK